MINKTKLVASQIFRIRSKRSNFFKLCLCTIVIYSMYLLLNIKMEFKNMPPTKYSSEDYTRILEARMLRQKLDWLSSQNNGLETREKEDGQHYESSGRAVKNEMKIANHKRFSMNVKIDVSINGRLAVGKSSFAWNQTWPKQVESILQKDKRLNGESVKEDIKLQKEKIISRRKYIFTLRYYEQLAGATKNLIDLASLAKHFNRGVVMPFINNSRMNGIQDKPEVRANKALFSNLSRYFDITQFNATLCERGYAPLAHFNDFIEDCKHGIDVLVHFIYNDSFSFNDAKNWFGMVASSWTDLRKRMPQYGGVQPCDFLRKSRIERLLGGVAVKEYTCVDPEIVRTADHLEKAVFRKQSCIAILQWKGMGKKRTHFPLPESIFQHLKPSDIVHNHTLVSIAKDFVERYIKQPFLAVHIRAERQLSWHSIEKVFKCINSLSKKVFQRVRTFQIDVIFLATDLPKYGSDTYKSTVNSERKVVQKYVNQLLRTPRTFKPELYGVYDKGDISIIEMNILSLGESLYTLGGGKFQQWIVELFLAHNTEDHSLIHRFCLERLD